MQLLFFYYAVYLLFIYLYSYIYLLLVLVIMQFYYLEGGGLNPILDFLKMGPHLRSSEFTQNEALAGIF
jgi:hypothetical protein